jgi:hypothetical protein
MTSAASSFRAAVYLAVSQPQVFKDQREQFLFSSA